MSRTFWRVASRVLAATLGGYVWVSIAMSLMASALSRLQLIEPAHAVMSGALLGFAVYVAVVLWVFSVRSALHAWLGLGLSGLLMGAALSLFGT